MLTKEDIEEYQQIYKKVYGEEISFEEAMVQGRRLLNFFKLITKQPVINLNNYKYGQSSNASRINLKIDTS